MPKLILASQSPRRKELLRRICKDFEVQPSGVDEIMDSALTPEANALAIARGKALWVARRHKGNIVIGADTIVVLDGQVIGKPKGANDACRILKTLAGQRHQVITGVVVISPAEEIFTDTVTSTVHIKPLSDEEIAGYVRTSEPLDKAGAYAIQGKGAFIVESHEGSYSNIVGLPLEALETLLRQAAASGDPG
ncbi:MAG: Maf family protein [Nitrospinota bacterium]|nr:Maf family protein [Nitrospinota bacterium]